MKLKKLGGSIVNNEQETVKIIQYVYPRVEKIYEYLVQKMNAVMQDKMANLPMNEKTGMPALDIKR